MNAVCRACVNEIHCPNAHVTDDEFVMSTCRLRSTDMSWPPPDDVAYIASAVWDKMVRDNPQPLTLEQLHRRAGKPVFLHTFSSKKHVTNFAEWALVVGVGTVVTTDAGTFGNAIFTKSTGYKMSKLYNQYGKTWLVYDYEPDIKEK